MPHRHQPIRIGAPDTTLGRIQAEEIVLLLKEGFPQSPFEIVATSEHGGVASTLEALASMKIDIAVLGAETLPWALPEGIAIGALTQRLSGADVLVAGNEIKALADLPDGCRVGTTSNRACAQVLERRSDLDVSVVENDTQSLIRRLDEDEFQAAVCPLADLRRLGGADRVSMIFEENEFIAAAGQGCLAALIRTGEFSDMAAHLMNPDSKTEHEAERTFHETIGVGPEAPVGVRGWVCGREMLVRGVIAQSDGKVVYRNGRVVPKVTSKTTGRQLGQGLLAEGGQNVIEAWKADHAPAEDA